MSTDVSEVRAASIIALMAKIMSFKKNGTERSLGNTLFQLKP
jgi:hypothetical protein